MPHESEKHSSGSQNIIWRRPLLKYSMIADIG
jgi:hypothetical protein